MKAWSVCRNLLTGLENLSNNEVGENGFGRGVLSEEALTKTRNGSVLYGNRIGMETYTNLISCFN